MKEAPVAVDPAALEIPIREELVKNPTSQPKFFSFVFLIRKKSFTVVSIKRAKTTKDINILKMVFGSIWFSLLCVFFNKFT